MENNELKEKLEEAMLNLVIRINSESDAEKCESLAKALTGLSTVRVLIK